jgi:hypothetical protein
VRAAFDFVEKTLDHIGGADGPPMFLGKSVEGQAGVQVTSETLDRGGGRSGITWRRRPRVQPGRAACRARS